MEIKIRKNKDTSIIDLAGSLDIYTATDFKTFLESNINQENNNLIVNLDKLTYIDSSGIGMLIKELNFIQQNLKGDMKLANMKPSIEKVFKVAGLTTYFHTLNQADFQKYAG